MFEESLLYVQFRSNLGQFRPNLVQITVQNNLGQG